MLKIRMQRTGRTNMPTFRIIVTEHTESPKTGNFVEKLGTYNPKTKERNLNGERIKYWLSVGAKASDTMHNMLIAAGIIEGKKINILPAYKAPAEVAAEEKAVEAEKSAEQEAKAKEEAPTEAPAAEVPADSTNSPQADNAEAKTA